MHPGSLRLIFIFAISINQVSAQEKTDAWLKDYIYEHASPSLRNVLDKPDSFRYQFIYTRIDRDSRNHPHLTNYYLHVDKSDYFNPASTVKMPLAFLALQKINELRIAGLNKETAMMTDSSYEKQSAVFADSSASNGLPSLAQYIRKIFLVSDNDSYNR